MKTISYIVCDNGLGHLRRSYFIASKLSLNYKIKIFCNKNKFARISFLNGSNEKIENIDLGFDLNYQNLIKNEYKLKLTESISNTRTDFIISDNLIFPTELDYKSILIANFLWEEVQQKNFLPNFSEKVTNQLVLGSEIFQLRGSKAFLDILQPR